MPTHRNTNKCKYIETKINERETIVTWQPHKQTIKQTNKQTNMHKRQTAEADYATSKRQYV